MQQHWCDECSDPVSVGTMLLTGLHGDRLVSTSVEYTPMPPIMGLGCVCHTGLRIWPLAKHPPKCCKHDKSFHTLQPLCS